MLADNSRRRQRGSQSVIRTPGRPIITDLLEIGAAIVEFLIDWRVTRAVVSKTHLHARLLVRTGGFSKGRLEPQFRPRCVERLSTGRGRECESEKRRRQRRSDATKPDHRSHPLEGRVAGHALSTTTSTTTGFDRSIRAGARAEDRPAGLSQHKPTRNPDLTLEVLKPSFSDSLQDGGTMMTRSILAASVAALLATSAHALAAEAGSLTQEKADVWRASKLPGVDVYGPDNKKVGGISDVLVAKDGKAQYIIVGVGGFLGIGEKDVAIPFEQVKFSDQPIRPATPDTMGVAPGNSASGAAPSPGVPATGSGAASMSAATGGPATPGEAHEAATRSMAYPDHGTIDLTADQLKAAPAFEFAK